MARPTQPVAVHQPRPRSAARASVDWDVRARTTAQESRRYTRFVALMKRVLLVAALAVVALVLAYSLEPRRQEKWTTTFRNLGIVNNDLAMEKPRLTGLDDSGNPYVVTADHAIRDAHKVRSAKLFKIDADLTEKKQGTWISMTAPTGMLDGDAHTLKLNGPIAVFSDDGNEFHTMAADVDLANGIVKGQRMIVGQGPTGNLRADSFWINRQTHIIVVNGNVHMTILPSGMRKGKKKP